MNALASPTLEFEPGVEAEITFEYNPSSQYSNKQKPTYIVRLNDTNKTAVSHPIAECHEQKKDTGMAKEYLNQLRKLSTEEVVFGITKDIGSMETIKKTLNFTDKQNQDNDLNNNEKNEESKDKIKRARSLSLPLKTLDAETDSDDVEQTLMSEDDVTVSSENVPTSKKSSQHPVSYRTDIEIKPSIGFERKFNSLRNSSGVVQERNVAFQSTVQFSPSVGLSPIQKLTENLNLIPNFRVQMSTHAAHDVTESSDPFSERRKSSSVRTKRSNHPLQNRAINSHVVKMKTKESTDDSPKDTKSEFGSRQRRRRTRPPVACTSSRLNTNLSRADGESLFSNSLPSGKLRQVLNNPSPRKESGNLANEPQISVTFSDTSNDSIRSLFLNRSDVAASTNVARESREGTHVGSSGIAKDSKSRQTSVKSKVSAYNNMICKHRNVSTGSSSTTSSNDLKSLQDVASREYALKEIDDNFVHLDSMLADLGTKSYSKNSNLGSKPFSNGNKSQSNEFNGVMSPENIARLQNRKNNLNVAGVDASEVRSQIGNRPVRENYLSPVSPSDISPSHMVRRPSAQTLSDELLFNLSESFAFGNRKSPRSLTPCATPSGNTPHESPVSYRRFTEPNPLKAPLSPGQYTQERRQTSAGSACSTEVQSEDLNRNISAFKKHHKRPPKSIQESGCTSPVFPFGGFQKVIHSEESYV